MKKTRSKARKNQETQETSTPCSLLFSGIFVVSIIFMIFIVIVNNEKGHEVAKIPKPDPIVLTEKTADVVNAIEQVKEHPSRTTIAAPSVIETPATPVPIGTKLSL